MPTSSLWEHYESEYVEVSRKVAQRLQESEPSARSIQVLESDLESARGILSQMEMALATCADKDEEKSAALAKLKAFRSDLNKFQSEAAVLLKERKIAEMKSARQKLFSDFPSEADIEVGLYPSPVGSGAHDEDNPTSRLLDTSDARLERAQKMALEAEQAGASILTDLRKQREQLRNASRMLRETDQDLNTSNRLVREMLRRAKANKAIFIGIVAFLIVITMFAIYSKLFR